MNTSFPNSRRGLLSTILSVAILSVSAQAQDNAKTYFKEGDTLRIESARSLTVDTTLTIIVPKGQNSLKNGKLYINVDEGKSNLNLQKTKFPFKNEFVIGELKDTLTIPYSITIPRDIKDDRTLTLQISAKDKDGQDVQSISQTLVIYIKPANLDTLSGDDNLELWFLTGTNFDLFNGVKAEEFFFRANTLFKIDNHFYCQISFYKNRYFVVDTSGGSYPYTNVKSPNPYNDSMYVLTSGTYRKNTKQTVDPLGVQLDVLYKISTNSSVSNFFATAGLDISTTNVTFTNSYVNVDTSFYLRTSKPDTVRGYNSYGTTAFTNSFSYKKPAYNVNVGFMWIFNDKDVNIKAHLTGGLSNYYSLQYFYQTRGAGLVYSFEKENRFYFQIRMFATYKPLGISFGMESFIRPTDVPAFNFTLSKAFDIKSLLKNLTPVSGLKL